MVSLLGPGLLDPARRGAARGRSGNPDAPVAGTNRAGVLLYLIVSSDRQPLRSPRPYGYASGFAGGCCWRLGGNLSVAAPGPWRSSGSSGPMPSAPAPCY